MKEMNKEKWSCAKTSRDVNPFGMMRRFTREMERMFDDFGAFRFPSFFKPEFAPFRVDFDKVEWVPQAEVLQNNGEFIVRVDLPGMTKEDVKVELTDEVLTLSGERKEEKEEKGEGFYRSERSYGSFYRQIPLPPGVKTEDAAATFRNGVLEITMPAPKAEVATRKLEIKEANVPKSIPATA